MGASFLLRYQKPVCTQYLARGFLYTSRGRAEFVGSSHRVGPRTEGVGKERNYPHYSVGPSAAPPSARAAGVGRAGGSPPPICGGGRGWGCGGARVGFRSLLPLFWCVLCWLLPLLPVFPGFFCFVWCCDGLFPVPV